MKRKVIPILGCAILLCMLTLLLWPHFNKCCESDPGYAEYEYYARLATERDIDGLKYMFENDMKMGLPLQASYYALLGALQGDAYLTESYISLYTSLDAARQKKDKDKVFKNMDMKGALELVKRLKLEKEQ